MTHEELKKNPGVDEDPLDSDGYQEGEDEDGEDEDGEDAPITRVEMFATFSRLRHLATAVVYLLKAHREALEAQAAQFDAQAQQIRWGSDQLPPGVNRQATADQLLEAAAKIRSETAVIEELEDPLIPDPYSLDDDDLLDYPDFFEPPARDSKGDSP